ncbi:MAG TPA: DUF2059 domain-containing protein [Rhizomicrobium sp.]|jgi:hypothetical protein|nr:DUF2059 domain-containing protein [Rhizomicrobium sp.]
MRLPIVKFAAPVAVLAATFSCLSAANGLAAATQTVAHPMQLPAPPATADDPAKVAAARDFLIAYRPNADPKVVAAMLDKLMPQAIAQAKQQNPKIDAKKLIEQQRAAYLANATQSLDLQALVVSRHFSLQELKALTAFFRGPLGKKMASETMNIQREVMREERLRQPLGGTMVQPPQVPAKAGPPKKS